MKTEKIMVDGRLVEHTVAETWGFEMGQPRLPRQEALEMITLIKRFPGAWEALVRDMGGVNPLFRYLLGGQNETFVRVVGVTLSFCDGTGECDWDPETREWVDT